MFNLTFLFALFTFFQAFQSVLLPIKVGNRKSTEKIELTAIGKFGLLRKERPHVREHLHTGIDIKRPGNNYANEPIYSIAKGVVISKRDDGPYAQLIIEHELNNKKIWTLYEHIAGIVIKVNDIVDPSLPIARFMNKEELNKYGWQFDHFHFEILKDKPIPIKLNSLNPERFFNSPSLICYSKQDLQKHFYDPQEFLSKNLK